MKKNISNKDAIFPMPVLMIATYNEDGSVDVMNAAWGMMFDMDKVVLNLTETHKSVKNIKNRGAFTVSIADSRHVKEADYCGVVSANNTPDKFEKSGLSYVKSNLVDAPIVNEFPICMECEFVEIGDAGVVGRVVNTSCEEECLTDGEIDISKVRAISYDPFHHGYYEIGEKVGQAFHDGLELK